MTYQETLAYLFAQLPMYQREGKSAYKKDLTNTIRLLEHLDNPHRTFKSVHIAGTNGKGTSAHGIAAILQTAGYHTGLYTSPHLKNFTERIRIDGREVEKKFVVEFVHRIKSVITDIQPSFFEITVAMAFDYFARQQVDIAVIETGLGGRLDSTNVITPEVCLITNIGYDHTDMLGDTLEKIALEKAGIIKEAVPVVIGETQEETLPVFQRVAQEKKAPLILAEKLDDLGWTPNKLVPSYFLRNFKGIRATIECLSRTGWKITAEQVIEGMNHIHELTGLKGRLQVLSKEPLTLADVSHNAEGLKVLFDQVRGLSEDKTIHLIFGTVKNKDLQPIFSTFPPEAQIYWTQSHVHRSLPVEELANEGLKYHLKGAIFPHLNKALLEAKKRANKGDLVVVTGSTFVIAEIEGL